MFTLALLLALPTLTQIEQRPQAELTLQELNEIWAKKRDAIRDQQIAAIKKPIFLVEKPKRTLQAPSHSLERSTEHYKGEVARESKSPLYRTSRITTSVGRVENHYIPRAGGLYRTTRLDVAPTSKIAEVRPGTLRRAR